MRQHSIGVAEELDLLETMFSINLLQIGSKFRKVIALDKFYRITSTQHTDPIPMSSTNLSQFGQL